MKIMGLSLALVMLLAFGSAGEILAMGAHGGPPSPQGEGKAGEDQKDKDGKKIDKAVGASPEKEKAEQPPPKKVPRIKYRDMYECGC